MRNIWAPLEYELKDQFGLVYCSTTTPLILYDGMPEDLVELMKMHRGGTKYALGTDNVLDPKELVKKTIKAYSTNFGEIRDVAIRFGISTEEGLKNNNKELKTLVYFLQQEKYCSNETDIKRLNILRKNMDEFSNGELINILVLMGEKDWRPEIAERQSTYDEIWLGNLKLPELTITLGAHNHSSN